jgi:hypothetical protein
MLSRSAALALLTERMKKKKITFCKAYKDWASEQWEKVMYSVQSNVQVHQVHQV